jgi:hypothetical protein
MSRAGATTSLWTVRALMFAIGIAVSYVLLPNQASGYARVSSTNMGDATAIFSVLQRSGNAIGVAILGVVLTVGSGHVVRAPVEAFHSVFAVAAAFALCGALLALRVRDADAIETMGGKPSRVSAKRQVVGASDSVGASRR